VFSKTVENFMISFISNTIFLRHHTSLHDYSIYLLVNIRMELLLVYSLQILLMYIDDLQ